MTVKYKACLFRLRKSYQRDNGYEPKPETVDGCGSGVTLPARAAYEDGS